MGETPTTSPACTRCGVRPRRTDSRGAFDDLCEDCENARVEETLRIGEYYQQHPDECCCHTYLGRHCCMAPAHGDRWRVNAISDGERFCYIIRAADRGEALVLGREMCQDNGEECVSVARVIPDFCIRCRTECGDQYWRRKGVRGHFCSEECGRAYQIAGSGPTPPAAT